MATEMKTIYEVPTILRREIEAKMIKPFLDAFEKELGHDKVMEIAKEVMLEISRRDGEEYRSVFGTGFDSLKKQQAVWGGNDALAVEHGQVSETEYMCKILKCEYIDMYKRIGMQEYGELLSCSRDEGFCEGIDPNMYMTRTKTLMNGDDCCDCLYHLKEVK